MAVGGPPTLISQRQRNVCSIILLRHTSRTKANVFDYIPSACSMFSGFLSLMAHAQNRLHSKTNAAQHEPAVVKQWYRSTIICRTILKSKVPNNKERCTLPIDIQRHIVYQSGEIGHFFTTHLPISHGTLHNVHGTMVGKHCSTDISFPIQQASSFLKSSYWWLNIWDFMFNVAKPAQLPQINRWVFRII